MIALDTNVVLRFLTRDDPAQAARARALIETKSIFVSRTVVLETEWVLRSGYRLGRSSIAQGLKRLIGLPGVEVEDADVVWQALDWFDARLDFADALHLAATRRATTFATFHRALRHRATVLAGAPRVIEP
jgi:predicted nucleic-acid-binding protein